MSKFKLLSTTSSRYIYSFITLDGTGMFSISKFDNSLKLLKTNCFLTKSKMSEKKLEQILFYGRKNLKIIFLIAVYMQLISYSIMTLNFGEFPTILTLLQQKIE